jgi:[NiFe] hydrogenase large subunit
MAQAKSAIPENGVRKIVLDPITRIEGHLRIETELTDGAVTNAWSTGSLFRGIEIILKGRNPEDAWLFTQRVCGVCTYVHGAASVRSVEDAVGISVPGNARIIRNLLMGAQFLHDHLVHFYHLHALDWVDIVSALIADPDKTSALAEELSPSADPIDFRAVQNRLKTFVAGGKLGPFAAGYWGHPAYNLSPEENLLFVAHYFEALRQQALTARMHAIFGGKNPHVQSLRVGGVTCEEDINESRIKEFRSLLKDTKTFIDHFYIPDVLVFAQRYPEWGELGGNDHFLVYGEFPQSDDGPESFLFPQGVIINRNGVESLDTNQIFEHVTHSWYEGTEALHPLTGETVPSYTGLNTSDRYSWLKAPRYDGYPMEVGPLARILVAYAKGQPEVIAAVGTFLESAGLEVESLNSTLGRTAARAIETKVIADAMLRWVEELDPEERAYAPANIPMFAQGMGLNEAPRGALGHWINVENTKIANYQMVVPSTWNFGPRCAGDKPGPVENALLDTLVVDAERPLEILRTIHSFDPCIACAVHVLDRKTARKYQVKVM